MKLTNALSEISKKKIITNLEKRFDINILELVSVANKFQDHHKYHHNSSHNRYSSLEVYRIISGTEEWYDVFCTECREIMIHMSLKR